MDFFVALTRENWPPTWITAAQPVGMSGSCCSGWCTCRQPMQFYQISAENRRLCESLFPLLVTRIAVCFPSSRNCVCVCVYLHSNHSVYKEQHQNEQGHIGKSLQHNNQWLCQIEIVIPNHRLNYAERWSWPEEIWWRSTEDSVSPQSDSEVSLDAWHETVWRKWLIHSCSQKTTQRERDKLDVI